MRKESGRNLFIRYLQRIKLMSWYICMGLWIGSFLNGCTEDYFSVDLCADKNVEALLSARSVAVTVCSDAYVDVGGYSEYKGTTCRTFVGGGEGLGSGQYYPGGFPQNGSATDTGSGGGGGRTFYVGDNWHFEFKNMSRLYGYGSTLNLVGKSNLEAVFSIQQTMPQDFDKLVDMLVRRNLRIDFKIDPTISSAAQYKGETRSILFQSLEAINWENFREELIHAVQHLCFYGNSMVDKYKNFEFEAKVFIDLAYGIATFYDNLPYYINYVPTFSDTKEEFARIYNPWILSICEKGWLPGSEYVTYHTIGKMWQGYVGDYLPNWEPKLIKDFFGKVRPPLKPEN